MKCPACGTKDTRVLDSRPFDDHSGIKRRRECISCGRRFTTYELVETVPLMVVKKDGAKQPFDRHKLKSGIIKACHKRPVDVDAVVGDIENELVSSMLGEVSSDTLGQMVMEHLKEIDDVSYVRFASVYREFTDLETFLQELNALAKGKGKKNKK